MRRNSDNPEDPIPRRQSIIMEAIVSISGILLTQVRKYSRLFLFLSFANGVSIDPLFFYILFIDEEHKCLVMDKQSEVAAIFMRSIMDIPMIVNIIYRIYRGIKAAKKTEALKNIEFNVGIKAAKRKKALAKLVLNICAVLPIPQVLIAVAAASKPRNSKYLDSIITLGFLCLAQTVLRISQVYYLSLELSMPFTVDVSVVFLYIFLIGHAIGGSWYFFSIERVMSCWRRACFKHKTTCSFFCDKDTTSRNMTFINSLDECLHVPENATAAFEYGIFMDSLKNGILVRKGTGYRKQFLYSFWWGLRNLSNFGTNLETSTYEAEICYTILISLLGILVFVFLIQRVQTIRSEQIRDQKFRPKKKYITRWVAKHNLNEEMKLTIMEYVKENSEDIKNADMENLFSILPRNFRKDLTKQLCRDELAQVFDANVNRLRICNYLIPVSYPDSSFILRAGDTLDRMLFITDGFVLTSSTNHNQNRSLKSHDYYGNVDLLNWVRSEDDPRLSDLPSLKEDLRCHSNVNCFVLLAKDLRTILRDPEPNNCDLNNSEESEEEIDSKSNDDHA